MPDAQFAERTFEQEMADLEAVVSRLESGNLPLEEALGAFEAGIGLVRTLNKRLNDAEARIDTLLRDPAGGLRLMPFEPGAEEST